MSRREGPANVFQVISPHTEQFIAEVAAAEPALVDAAVNAPEGINGYLDTKSLAVSPGV